MASQATCWIIGLLFWSCCAVSADEALWTAAKQGQTESVARLLEEGVPVDAKTKYGATALSFAAERGHLETAKLLLERGADVNNRDTFYGYTPRTWAQFGGHTEVVSLLDEHGGTLSFGNASSSGAKNRAQQDSNSKATERQPSRRQAKDTDDEHPDDEHAEDESTEDESTEDGNTTKHGDTKHRNTKHGNTKHGDVDNHQNAESDPTSTDDGSAEAAVFEFPRLTDEEILEDDLLCASANWPQFRGTGARGIADGQTPPTSWDGTKENETNLAFRAPIPGLGNSSPVIWQDRVYLTTAISDEDDQGLKTGYYGSVDSVDDDSEHEFVVICLDAKSGAEIWRQTATKAVPQIKRHLKSTHADPTVATDGKYLVASFGAQGLYCYDLSGQLIWKKDLGAIDSGWFYDPDYQWEFGSSPIIHDDRVIVQCDVQEDSFLAAFELAGGEEVWRTERDEIPSWGTPTAFDTPSGPLLFTNGTHAMRCYYLDTGQLAWTFSENSEITTPTPFVAYRTAFLTAGYRPIQPIRAITLSARGDLTLPDGESQSQFVRWSTRKGGPYLPTPIAYRGNLYVCSNAGILTCYDAQSGEQHYKQRLETPGQRSFVGSSVAADGHLYFTAEDGHVMVVAEGNEFELISTNPVGDSVLSTPAISSGAIYFRTPTELIAFRDTDATAINE